MEDKKHTTCNVISSGDIAADDLHATTVENAANKLHTMEATAIAPESLAGTANTRKAVLHRAATRGHVNNGWLESYQTFGFAEYYNPERMHFGVLRVLNDDWVAPGMGFGSHPHDNMEIISIPLDGALEHTDSMNNRTVIDQGDIQVMSAGTGIFHAEYNHSLEKPVSFLQIWLFPKVKNVAPRYHQLSLRPDDRYNKLQQILSPNEDDEGVWIYQDAWFYMGRFDKDRIVDYTLKKNDNGVYIFVIKGELTVDGLSLHPKDGVGIWNTGNISLKADSQGAEVLLMEVPMAVS